MRLFQLLSWGVLIYIGYRILTGFLKGKKGEQAKGQEDRGYESAETFLDPVCGRYVSEDDSVVGRNNGERVHFCSMECLERYREKLEKEASLIEPQNS